MIELIKDRKVLVIGMARSGVAAARLLAESGASKVTVADQKTAEELRNETGRLMRYPTVEIITGGTSPGLVRSDLAMIIKSPGVPPGLAIFKEAAAKNVPVYSEIELAYHFIKAPMIGITGTNGKTTTTALITAMLKEARFDPVVSAGNIGNPLCSIVGTIEAQGLIVLELSSFQLDNIAKFRPLVAVFLNFAEDHIDYHGSLDQYYAAKARIIENQLKSDYAVLNAADDQVARLAGKCKSQVLWFDREPVDVGIGILRNWITLFNPGMEPQKICPVEDVSLPGDHNLENVLAASTAAWAAGADLEAIGTVLRSFKAIEHRLEHVATINDVDFINDSKGTNPGSTMKALQSFPGRRIVLIAGGKDKGSDFSDLARIINCEVKSLILYGETKKNLVAAVEKVNYHSYSLVNNLEEAVALAFKQALPEDIVLLSPACASWDMFPDYEARGNLFKDLVKKQKRDNKAGKGAGDRG